MTQPTDADPLPLLLGPLILRVDGNGEPLVGGLVEDPRLGSELATPNRGAERARRSVVTALSGILLYEEHGPQTVGVLTPRADAGAPTGRGRRDESLWVGILHKSAPVKKGRRCLPWNCMT